MNFKKHYFSIASFIFTIAFLAACAVSDKLSVVERNFDKEVDNQQNLVFTFNKDIATEAQLDQWLDKEYVKITPAVQGKFKWTSANTLVFSPDKGFLPSNDYKAELTPALLENLNGEKLALDEMKEFAFNTPYLALKGVDMFWASSQSGSPQVNMNLQFNYAVKTEDVAKLLALKLDGQDVTYQMISTGETSTVKIALPEREASLLAKKGVKLALSEGLATMGNRKGEKMTFDTEIPAIDQFQIMQASTERMATETFVRIYTNQAIGNSEKEIENMVSVDPKVSFTVELADFGFIVKGNFYEGQNYTLTVDKKLKGIFGKSLVETYNHYLAFGRVSPKIRFSDAAGIYLTSKGEKNIGLKVYGMEKVEIQVYKVYQNNILHYIRSIANYLDSGDSEYDYFYEGTPDNFGDLVYEKAVDLKDMPKNGEQYLINFDNIQKLDKMPFEGVYFVMARSVNDRWIKHGQIVSVSDVGLMARQTKNEILIIANSIKTAQPLINVDISLVSKSNQEAMKGRTNIDGVAVFPLNDLTKKMTVDMVTARLDNEFSFMYLSQNQVATDRYDVGGLSSNQAGYQAFIYGQRELYRPGEKMYFKTILRNDRWNPVANLPIKMSVLLPNGKVFISKKGTANEQGTYEMQVDLPENAVTGAYSVEVSTANGVVLASKGINVEDFMPQRIKINAKMDKEIYAAGEAVKITGQALNLFGPPAADRKYEAEMVLRASTFKTDPKNKTLAEYDFSLRHNKEVYLESVVNEGTTGSRGEFEETFDIPSEYYGLGSIEGKLYTVVFDETGRPVGKTNTFNIYSQDHFFGIRHLDGYWFGLGSTLSFPLVAVNQAGKTLVSAQARVVIVRKEWQTVLEKNYYGDYQYVSREREHIVREQKVSITGTGTAINFVPTHSGYHEVRVYTEDAPENLKNNEQVISYVSSSFYAYAWGNATASSFQVDKEGEVKIVFDKETYNPGDKAKILFKTPFKGRMMVTVERDKVYDYFFVNTSEKSASLEIPIKAEYLPNVYVSATLIRPMDKNEQIPITVAHGYQNTTVEDKSSRIAIEILSVEKSRSNTSQEITVKTNRPDAELTVAVVDEGIMQIKNQQTPDPHGFFYQKRALEVTGFDLYKRLLPELSMKAGRFGADGYDMNGRNNPLANRRVKPFAAWSGTLKTDKNGVAKYTVPIPQFSGEARIMAVAVKDNAFGSHESRFKIADPIVVSVGVPRFLSPDDQGTIPVTVTNTTNNTAEAVVKIETSEILTVGGTNAMNVSIPANTEKQVLFTVSAKNKIGETFINVKVNAFGETFASDTELTVRPSAGLIKESSSGEIQAGKEESIAYNTSQFIAGSSKGKLIISRSPLIRFTKNLTELIGYPHGCVEQTISTAFPQIYLSDISKILGKEINGVNDNDPNWNVKQAITKLQGMQLYSGGLTYWQGGESESWWGSVYAAHFLLEARRAGFDVDKAFMDKLFEYVTYKATEKKTEDYFYYANDNRRLVRKIAPREVVYSLYVMALAGKQDVSTMNYYKANLSVLAKDSQYMLAITYKMLGDSKSYATLLPNSFGTERSDYAFDGSFYSPLRDKAITLNAMIDSDGDNPQIGIFAKQISDDLRNMQYINTQESAFSLLALGKLAKKAANSTATATISSDGGNLGSFTGETLVLKDKIFSNLKIKTQGTGSLYYFWEASGVSATGKYKEEDKFIKVRREFMDRQGNMIRTGNFKQNDLIVVRVWLQSTNSSDVENVVITDMLPAGLEVENPRLNGDRAFAWAKDANEPTHIDYRDDRINMFVRATPKAKAYYYVVRGVSKGTYKIGPVSADAMYNGEYHSYHGGGIVKVN